MKAAPLFLIALFGVTGCARHMQTAAQIDLNQQSREEATAKVDTEIHKVEGPGRVTTTTEEFAAAASRADGKTGGTQPLVPAGSQSGQPQLIRRVTTVEERGPITTDTHAKADSSAVGARTAILDGRVEQVKDSKPSLGIPWLMLLGGGVAAAALLTRTVWVGPLLTLCKRLLGRG